MTTASALALGTPSFTSSVQVTLRVFGEGWVWVSSSSYDVIATGAPAHSSRRAVRDWQNFHHDVSSPPTSRLPKGSSHDPFSAS